MDLAKKIHCLGIGGVGVGAIAELLLHQGYKVSGTDSGRGGLVNHLAQIGATIYEDHSADNLKNADIVVYSTAIQAENPELQAARALSLDVCHRAEMLARIMQPFKKITVAGTHGKTTTSSMMANLLLAAGLDPSFVIGGKVHATQSNAHLGNGEWFVAEADESDASFLHLDSDIAIVTNIDEDHMQTYDHDVQKLLAAFVEYLQKIPHTGLAVLCHDDVNIRAVLSALTVPVKTYGFSESVDWRLTEFCQTGITSHFTLVRKGLPDLTLSLQMPGKHNALNATATAIAAHELGLSDEQIAMGLAAFAGVGRRFQLHGEWPVAGGMATIVEDYGHHPEEVVATIRAARECWPEQRLVMVFQPHRFTRTHDLFTEFVAALSQVDVLILPPVYAACEQPIAGADSQALAEALATTDVSVHLLLNVSEVNAALEKLLLPGDVVFYQGAGDIGQYASKLLLAS